MAVFNELAGGWEFSISEELCMPVDSCGWYLGKGYMRDTTFSINRSNLGKVRRQKPAYYVFLLSKDWKTALAAIEFCIGKSMEAVEEKLLAAQLAHAKLANRMVRLVTDREKL
jgi:hypothetical protein